MTNHGSMSIENNMIYFELGYSMFAWTH